MNLSANYNSRDYVFHSNSRLSLNQANGNKILAVFLLYSYIEQRLALNSLSVRTRIHLSHEYITKPYYKAAVTIIYDISEQSIKKWFHSLSYHRQAVYKAGLSSASPETVLAKVTDFNFTKQAFTSWSWLVRWTVGPENTYINKFVHANRFQFKPIHWCQYKTPPPIELPPTIIYQLCRGPLCLFNISTATERRDLLFIHTRFGVS